MKCVTEYLTVDLLQCSILYCEVHCLGRWESLACHGTGSVMIQLDDFPEGRWLEGGTLL